MRCRGVAYQTAEIGLHTHGIGDGIDVDLGKTGAKRRIGQTVRSVESAVNRIRFALAFVADREGSAQQLGARVMA
jgi:hypothetical protein